MKNKSGWTKKHNLTECATAIVLGIAKLTLMGPPVVAQTVYKMIRFFLAADSDPEWEKRREKSGGNTFGMVDSAVKEYLDKPEKIKD